MNTDTKPATSSAPGRPGLSFEAYEDAYQELCAPDGTPPSQRQLRKFLGTGSNTTLAGYRRRIADERIIDELPPEAGSVDAEILTLVQRLASQMAIDEAQVADDRVDEIQSEASNRIRIAETTMEKRLQDTALLEHRANTAEATIAEQKKALSEWDDKHTQLESELQSSRGKSATLNQSLEDSTRQLATLTRQHDALQLTLDEVRQEGTVEKERHQHALSMAGQTLSETKTELATAIEQNANLATRISERNNLIETLNTQQKEQQQRFEQVNEAREANLVQLDDVQQAVTALKVLLSTRDAELTAEQNAHGVSRGRLKSALSEVNQNEAQTRLLQATLEKLSVDKPDKPTRDSK